MGNSLHKVGRMHHVLTDKTVSKKGKTHHAQKSAAASHKGFDLTTEKLFGAMDLSLRKVIQGKEELEKMLDKALEDAPALERIDRPQFGAARFGETFPAIRLGEGNIDRVEKKVTSFPERALVGSRKK